MRVSRQNIGKASSGLRSLGSVAGKFNNSRLGQINKVANPKLAMVSKAVEIGAPKLANAIDRGVEIYDKAKPVVKSAVDAYKKTKEDFDN